MDDHQYPAGADPLPEDLCEHFEAFLATDGDRPSGNDIYPEVLEAPLLFPLQRTGEIRRMMQVARTIKPKVVYEIGADKGGGFYHWCKSQETVERAICCEIRGTPYSRLFEQAFPGIDFLWLPESSYAEECVARVWDWLGEDQIDVLFIDGDKCYFDLDFDTYFPMMSRPSIVFMHDIQDESTGDSYRKVVARGCRHEEIIDKTDVELALTRESDGIPAATCHEQWLRYWHGRSAGVGVIYLD